MYTITKLPESGDLCGNITEFEVTEGSIATPNNVILPYRSPDEGCFVFISYCLMILCHFQLKYMRSICIYYCIYLIKLKCGNTLNSTIMQCYLCGVIITSDVTIVSIVTS